MAGSGGAWKVAFADFMTAMMALFLVLWISSQDKEILIATSKYFQNPFNSPMTDHSGVMPFNKQSSNSSGSDDKTVQSKAGESSRQVELQFLNTVAADFTRLLHLDQTADQSPVDIQVTSDGLRITLFNRARQPIFDGDTADFTDYGRNVMQSLSWMIERNHFRVTIDGHTRSGMQLARPDYSAWDLSSDRANAARRQLVHYAVAEAQIDRVSGYADTRPVKGTPPESEENQRIALSLSIAPNSRDKPVKADPVDTAVKPVISPPVPPNPSHS